MANQIQLSGDFRREEAIGSGALYPGMMVELTSLLRVRAHSTEGGEGERAFVVEDALQGKTVDDVYATGTLVSYNIVARGAVIMARIDEGQNITMGEKLMSSGEGNLIGQSSAVSSGELQTIIAVALEDLDLSDSGSGNQLCMVRIL
jgi:hypothetical protein